MVTLVSSVTVDWLPWLPWLAVLPLIGYHVNLD